MEAEVTLYRDQRRVGIVIERRRLDSPWQDEAWLPIAILSPPPREDDWRVLRTDGGGRQQIYAGSLVIELFRKEISSYRYNLETGVPKVYVVLRRTDDAARPWRPHLATVAPDEAEAALEGGADIMDGVAMPADLVTWIVGFVALQPTEEPFHKRQRGAKTPVAPATGSPS
jgi:hypothetical protein